eukprot:symbB.v1.2.018303.t1/scaffold1434.1/size119003/4
MAVSNWQVTSSLRSSLRLEIHPFRPSTGWSWRRHRHEGSTTRLAFLTWAGSPGHEKSGGVTRGRPVPAMLGSLQPVLEKAKEKCDGQGATCLVSKTGLVLQSVGDVPPRPEFLTKVAQGCARLEPTLQPPVITVETTCRKVTIMEDEDLVIAVAEKAD